MGAWTKNAEDVKRAERAAKMREICERYDVEYLGLSGFAGPGHAEAEAAWREYRDSEAFWTPSVVAK